LTASAKDMWSGAGEEIRRTLLVKCPNFLISSGLAGNPTPKTALALDIQTHGGPLVHHE
jgi:hypothetical protein